MIRQDRELLAELAQLNSDVTPFAMRIIDDSCTAEEQHEFADRLITLGRRFHQRATGTALVIEGEALTALELGCGFNGVDSTAGTGSAPR